LRAGSSANNEREHKRRDCSHERHPLLTVLIV
jgi:hypothetical protein